MTPWLFASFVGPACFVAGFFLRPLLHPRKDSAMAVYQEIVQPLADLQAAVDALPAKLAAANSAGAQDKTDTITAVTTGAAAAVAAINAIGQPA